MNSTEARLAVMEGRPCLAKFSLDKYQWHNFDEFYKSNPKGILTKQIIETVNDLKNTTNISGHAVVLISVEEHSLLFLNSWGKQFADNGYFRIENENVLCILSFMDVYWD